MLKFINKWKKLDERFALSLRNTDQDNNFIDTIIEKPELRKLTMDSEDDQEFIRNLKVIPKTTGKAYDYMQMERLLSKSILRRLYDKGLYEN